MIKHTTHILILLTLLSFTAKAQKRESGWRFPAPGWTPIVSIEESTGLVFFDLGDGFSGAFVNDFTTPSGICAPTEAIVRIDHLLKLDLKHDKDFVSQEIIRHAFRLDDQKSEPVIVAHTYDTDGRSLYKFLILDNSTTQGFATVKVKDSRREARVNLSFIKK